MIPWEIQNLTLLIPLILVALVGAFALFRCRGDKRSFFVLVAFTAFMHILGYYLEIVGTGIAFTGMYLANFGGGLCVLATVLFISEYCDTKMHAAFKAILCAGAFLYIFGVWTTGITGYYNASFELNFSASNPLTYASGTLSWLFSLYYVVYIAIALIIIIRKIVLSYGDFRKTLVLTLIAFLIPVIATTVEGTIAAGGSSVMPVFLTPYAYGISAIICYVSIKKYDMLDKAPFSSIQAINTIAQAMILLDDKLRYVSANSSAVALFPWLKEYKNGEAIYYSPHWPTELSHNAFSNGEFSVDFVVNSSDNSRHYHAVAHPFNPDVSHKNHWSIMVQDVTDKELLIKQLEEAAYTDTLTGLYNRRHFAEIATPYVERTKRTGVSYYIMMADLDFFKIINDTHGHLAGDSVLRHVAAIMKRTVRSYDIVARWGGEEFIFLITDSSAADVVSLAERIRNAVEHTPCEYNGEKLPITISFGIAQSKDENNDMTALILRADEALYKSKRDGRNRVTIWSEYA